MGLAAVTEANTGDLTVKPEDQSQTAPSTKSSPRCAPGSRKPSRSSIPNTCRCCKTTSTIFPTHPNLSRSSSSARTSPCCSSLGTARRRKRSSQGQRRGRVYENGVDNTISGPATSFQVDPQLAARLGFTPQEVAEDATAILDGVTVNDPVIANGTPLHRPRAPWHRDAQRSREASATRSSTQPPATPRRSAP